VPLRADLCRGGRSGLHAIIGGLFHDRYVEVSTGECDTNKRIEVLGLWEERRAVWKVLSTVWGREPDADVAGGEVEV